MEIAVEENYDYNIYFLSQIALKKEKLMYRIYKRCKNFSETD